MSTGLVSVVSLWVCSLLSISFGQQIELMFVDTVMSHMRKQKILQNYKIFAITSPQTHKTVGGKIMWVIIVLESEAPR